MTDKQETFEFLGKTLRYADLTEDQNFYFTLLVEVEATQVKLVNKLKEEFGIDDTNW